jgi:hypothetical protein
MNCVLPRLSAIHATTWPWSYPKSVLIGGLLIHMFGIGRPIALAVPLGFDEKAIRTREISHKLRLDGHLRNQRHGHTLDASGLEHDHDRSALDHHAAHR